MRVDEFDREPSECGTANGRELLQRRADAVRAHQVFTRDDHRDQRDTRRCVHGRDAAHDEQEPEVDGDRRAEIRRDGEAHTDDTGERRRDRRQHPSINAIDERTDRHEQKHDR